MVFQSLRVFNGLKDFDNLKVSNCLNIFNGKIFNSFKVFNSLKNFQKSWGLQYSLGLQWPLYFQTRIHSDLLKVINGLNNGLKVFNAQWGSALEVRGQIFEHSSNYFTIWRITKMLISQPNLNRFAFCKKTPKCLSFASVFKHSPHF